MAWFPGSPPVTVLAATGLEVLAGTGEAWSCVLPAEDERRGRRPGAQRSAVAMRHSDLAVRDLHGRMSLTAKLADRLDHLGHSAPVHRVVVAQPAAVGVERQPAVRSQ